MHLICSVTYSDPSPSGVWGKVCKIKTIIRGEKIWKWAELVGTGSFLSHSVIYQNAQHFPSATQFLPSNQQLLCSVWIVKAPSPLLWTQPVFYYTTCSFRWKQQHAGAPLGCVRGAALQQSYELPSVWQSTNTFRVGENSFYLRGQWYPSLANVWLSAPQQSFSAPRVGKIVRPAALLC